MTLPPKSPLLGEDRARRVAISTLTEVARRTRSRFGAIVVVVSTLSELPLADPTSARFSIMHACRSMRRKRCLSSGETLA
jgi:hypothetical protein